VTGDTIGFRQQLSTTSFNSCERTVLLQYISSKTWLHVFLEHSVVHMNCFV